MLFLIYLLCMIHGLIISQKPVHKVSTKTHDYKQVSSMLYGFYSDAYNLNSNANRRYITNFNSIALQYTSDPECVEKSTFRYFIKSFSLIHNEYPASECNLNTNMKFVSMVTPKENFHLSVHGTLDRLASELLQKSEGYIEELPDFEFRFYDFDNLNYNLTCENNYFELMQVMYREKVLEVTLQIVVTVPEKCTFANLNPEFKTSFGDSTTVVHLPLTGQFFCQPGKTVSCKKDLAISKNSRYKLYD